MIALIDLGRDGEAAAFHVDQQLPTALGAFPHADLKPDQFLPTFRRGSDEDQHALGMVLHPDLEVDPIRPEIDITPGRQVPLLPAIMLGPPLGRKASDHRGRKVRYILTQQRRQRFLEVARRDTAQVQRRQQGVEDARPPSPSRQDRLSEPDALAAFGSPTIPDLGARHRDSADPGLHLALWAMPVPDKAHYVVRKLQIRPLSQRGLDLQFYRPGQELSSAGPQHLRQRIVDRIGLTKPDDIAILIYGVLLSPERFWQAWTPASIRRLSQAAVTQIPA